MKKARMVYGSVFGVLLLIEIFIGLFIHDHFVRPYIGDLLVTILLCCFFRTMIPKGVPALPIYVFAFTSFVEMAQYFNVVKLLGWENNPFLSTIIGTTFSLADLLCYGVGCFVFWIVEKTICSFLKI